MYVITLTLTVGLLHYGAALDAISAIPSKQDQMNMLNNVKNVFDTIRTTINEERSATDAAAALEIHHTATQAMNYLVLVKDLTFLKIANLKSENSVCQNNVKSSVQKVIREGEELLQICLDEAINNIYNNSQLVATTIGEAMNQGDAFLDALNKCSQKPGLQLISCYKKVIATDVFPLKLILINALNVHKSSHLEVISVKSKSNECVDNVLEVQQEKMNKILDDLSKSCNN
ncbi:hypothetical protein RN001_014384 [Aquatica leii]|uniref:Protein TsetseEP domain-containing protein n=1 Tax=Aquatica leii TaxID=1421715 RepID=A0AAN7SN50_9COLE|nr:hypothetical protein RN001_014384 [Aquatica leii]